MVKKLLVVVNVDWFLISHRLCIAEKAIQKGWDVYVACNDTGRVNEITEKGIKFINLPISRSGTNVVQEFKTILSFYKVYKKIKPDVLHQVTLKPIVYGSFVAKLLGIRGVVNAISGLGYNFTEGRKGLVQKLMIFLMKFGFDRNNTSIIFQNKDDFNEMNSLKIISAKNTINFIKGSGVDLNKYLHSDFKKTEKVKILFSSRMLLDKGVAELRKASEILKPKYKGKIIFILAGLADKENIAGVDESFMKDWEHEGYVEWIGYKKDMVSVYENSDIVVLPSYREGLPKSLIEACATGRPIVTTDAIGCKECVDEGINGFKVPVKSVEELVDALEKLILSRELREVMGRNSRIKAEKEFSLKNVVDTHLDIYTKLYGNE